MKDFDPFTEKAYLLHVGCAIFTLQRCLGSPSATYPPPPPSIVSVVLLLVGIEKEPCPPVSDFMVEAVDMTTTLVLVTALCPLKGDAQYI